MNQSIIICSSASSSSLVASHQLHQYHHWWHSCFASASDVSFMWSVSFQNLHLIVKSMLLWFHLHKPKLFMPIMNLYKGQDRITYSFLSVCFEDISSPAQFTTFSFLPPAFGAVWDQDHRLPVRLCIKTGLNCRLILPSPFSRQKYSLCAKWLEGRLNWASDRVRQQQDCSRASRGQK